MLDQIEGPSSPALCSHSGQAAVDQGPTEQDMVQQHLPTHIPQQLVHTGLLPQILEVAHNHQGSSFASRNLSNPLLKPPKLVAITTSCSSEFHK